MNIKMALEANQRHTRATQLVLLVLLLLATTTRSQEASSTNTITSGSATGGSSTLRLPGDPVFNDPWVKKNIALTYGHVVQDGIGSQTVRMLSVYALARTLGIGHVFKPLDCVGHIGSHVHYRDVGCNFTNDRDRRQLAKAQHLIAMPSTANEQDMVFWNRRFMVRLDFKLFVKEVQEALQKKRPTLFMVERMQTLARAYPDIFLSIKKLRPAYPPAPLACRQPGITGPDVAFKGRPWLLDALRVAIHVRRGDVITDNWHERVLTASYFINVAKSITSVLEAMSCYYSVEVYIESPRTPEGVTELKVLRESIPHSVMLVDTDMLWSWQMMATADIVVMSNSMFSMSAALMNPNSVGILVPEDHYVKRGGMFKMRHWFIPQDNNGTLPQAAVDEIRRRVGVHGNSNVGQLSDLETQKLEI